MTRSTLSSLLCVALMLVMLGAGVVAPARAGEPPRFVGEACPAALFATGRRLECGSIAVPQARSGRPGIFITLPIVIVRAAAPRPGAPPVLYLHGGPGGGVVAGLEETLLSPIGADLVAQDQDWIFFDQRGAAGATPSLDCGDLALNDAGPANPQVVAALGLCFRNLEARGVDFRRYASADVVADIQDIRRALDLREIDLYGFSYGTRVALTHDPSGVRAVVLDSPWPPEARWTESTPGWVSREMREVLAMCQADPDCAARYGDLEPRFDRLMAELGAAPVRQGDRLYGSGMMALFLMDALYEPDGVSGLPAALSRFVDGDFRALDPYQHGSDAGYAEALHMAVLCNEEFPFERPEAVLAGARGDHVAEAVAATMVNYFAACDLLGPRRPDPVEQRPVSSPVPTLFLAAGIDAGCPAELSAEAVRRFRKGRLAVFPMSTHGIARNSPCGRRLARAFLRSPEAPLEEDCHDENERGIVFK